MFDAKIYIWSVPKYKNDQSTNTELNWMNYGIII